MAQKRLCRLCLKRIEFYSLIDNNISNIIKQITSLNIEYNDKFSNVVCIKCLNDLHVANDIRNRIIESDKKLCSESFLEKDTDVNSLTFEEFVKDIDSDSNSSNTNKIKENDDVISDSITNYDNNETFENIEIKVEPFENDMNEVDPNLLNDEYHHTKDKGYTILVTKADIIIEQLNKTKPYEYFCTVCQMEFKDNLHGTKLTLHKGSHLKSKCNTCGLITRTDNMAKHVAAHNLGPQVCEFCGSNHKSIEGLRSHLATYHSNKKPVKCEKCGETFKVRARLYEHINRIHTNVHDVGEVFTVPDDSEDSLVDDTLNKQEKLNVDITNNEIQYETNTKNSILSENFGNNQHFDNTNIEDHMETDSFLNPSLSSSETQSATSSIFQTRPNLKYGINELEKLDNSNASDIEFSLSECIPFSEYLNTSGSRTKSTALPLQNINVPELTHTKVMRYFNSMESSITQTITSHELPKDNIDIPSLTSSVEIDTPNRSFVNNLKTASNGENQYKKSPSTRGRTTLCPICFKDVPTHFVRHLLRHHPKHKDVKKISNLEPSSKERLAFVSLLRKRGYFHLKADKNILNPVRSTKDSDVAHFACIYCLGYYSKKLLYKHVKNCKNKPENFNSTGRNCLSRSQTLMSSAMSKNYDLLKSSRMTYEVMSIMRPDSISETVKNDSLIILYGEELLNRHNTKQIATMISNKVREVARLFIALKSINNTFDCLFDSLRPDIFNDFISATKLISGYDVSSKNFKSPTLALHMGSNLKIVCDVAYKIVLEQKNVPNIKWEDPIQKRNDINDLKKLIESYWNNEISCLALKNLNERQCENSKQLPLSSDIETFLTYLNDFCINSYYQLSNNLHVDITHKYKVLSECVLALTILFNRNRVGDVQYLTINTYKSNNTDHIIQEAFFESLTVVEKIIYKKNKLICTGDGKPIPILFSKDIQKYINYLLEVRKTYSVVPESNPYLFANPGSENRWMSGNDVVRKLARNCGAQHASLLTSFKFRKHIATVLQLLSMEEDEMEQVATFMGHTKSTHAEFYRSPQDICQTLKLAKVLLLLEKGKGKEFKGKSLNDIVLEKEIYYSSESESEKEENVSMAERTLERVNKRLNMKTNNIHIDTTILESQTTHDVVMEKDLIDNELTTKTTSEKEIILLQSKADLETHDDSKANKDKIKYQCDACGKSFRMAKVMKKHIDMVHKRLREHVCEHCKKGFSTTYALKTHVRQHTGELPYNCQYCSEGYRQLVSLRTHMKSKHKIDMPANKPGYTYTKRQKINIE